MEDKHRHSPERFKWFCNNCEATSSLSYACRDLRCAVGARREANADAPPFETIARTFGFNGEKLVFFLLEPHPKMPSMALTRSEANDIATYIGKLAK